MKISLTYNKDSKWFIPQLIMLVAVSCILIYQIIIVAPALCEISYLACKGVYLEWQTQQYISETDRILTERAEEARVTEVISNTYEGVYDEKE